MDAEPTNAQRARLVAVIDKPIPLDGLSALAKEYPGTSITQGRWGGFWIFTEGEHCGCMTCEDATAAEYRSLTGDWIGGLFIVCPDCGNKRCPRAAFHGNDCTQSNEPGQPGGRG